VLTGPPLAIVDGVGHVQVFSGGTDGQVWVVGWTSNGWGAWQGLGVPPGVGNPIGPLAGATGSDGRIEIFLRAWSTNGHIVNLLQQSSGGAWSAAAWDDLGLASTGDPVALADAGGVLNLFAAGPNGEPHHRRQITRNGDRWGDPWQRLGGGMLGPGTIALNVDGRIEVFVRGTDSAHSLFHIWQETAGMPFHGMHGF
jgi:hypothetical protein